MYNINRIPLKRRPIVLSDETPDNFLGLGKRARRRKDERVAIRNERKRSKIESRAYKKRVKADALAKRYSGKAEAGIIAAQGEAAANMALAQQGIIGNPVTQQTDLASQALGVAGNIFGGGRAGNGDSLGSPADEQYYEEDQLAENQLGIKEKQAAEQQGGRKSNTTLYLLIGGAVLLAGFMYMKKK